MRQVMLEAKASNKSAITYHFGDLESLVRAIWTRRLPEIERVRVAMLGRLEAEGRTDDAMAVAEVLFVPSYLPTDSEGRHRYAAFLRNALRWVPGRLVRQEEMRLTPSSAKALDLFHNIFNYLPTPIFEYRVQAASNMFLGLAHDRDLRMDGSMAALDQDVFLREAVSMATGCMAAPLTIGTDDLSGLALENPIASSSPDA